MNNNAIATDPSGGTRIEVSEMFDTDFCNLLESTEFGGDGLKFYKKNVAASLEALHDPVFVRARRGQQLVGCYVLDRLPGVVNGETANGVYRGWLAVDKNVRKQGVGKLIVESTRDWLYSAESNLDDSRPVLTWGCIESDNAASIRTLKASGAKLVTEITTALTYRQWPAISVDVVSLKDCDPTVGEEVLRLLTQQNKTISTGLDWAACLPKDYMVIRHHGEVVAGASVRLNDIDFATSSTVWRHTYNWLFRYVPPARKRFNPTAFRYIKLDHLLVRPGHETVWKQFVSSLMAINNVHMAMVSVDQESSLVNAVAETGILGRFSRMTTQKFSVYATCRSDGFDILDQSVTGETSFGLME